jgi:uncharacterized protein YkwD
MIIIESIIALLMTVSPMDNIRLDEPIYFEMLPGSREGHMAKDTVYLNELQKEIFYWTNYARANPDEFAEQCGYAVGQFRPCQPVMWNGDLTVIAQYHCEDMYKDNYFEHDSYDRVDGALVKVMGAFERIASSGYVGQASENIFWAGYKPTGKSAVMGWLTSPPHRANMLNCNWNELGVGAYSDTRATYCCQDFGYREKTVDAAVDENTFDVQKATNSMNPFEYIVTIGFNVTGLFDVNPVSLTLYDGNPSRGGVEVGTYRSENIFVTTYHHEAQFTWDTADLKGIRTLVAQLTLETPYPDENPEDNVVEFTYNLAENNNDAKPNLAIFPDEKGLIAVINEIRANPAHYAADFGYSVFEYDPVPPLVPNADLTLMARDQADDMVAQGKVTNNSSDGLGPADRAEEIGYQGTFNEEIGFKTNPEIPAFDLLQEMFADFRIQRKLLSSAVTEFGSGFSEDNNGKYYWVLEVGYQDYRFGIKTRPEWLKISSKTNTIIKELNFEVAYQNWGFNDIQGVQAVLYDGPPSLNTIIDKVTMDTKIVRTGLRDTINLTWFNPPNKGTHDVYCVITLANGFEELDLSDNTIIKSLDLGGTTAVNCIDFAVIGYKLESNGSVLVMFNQPASEDVEFKLFDPRGRFIEQLTWKTGESKLYWSGNDYNRVRVPTGIYYMVGSDRYDSLKSKIVILR